MIARRQLLHLALGPALAMAPLASHAQDNGKTVWIIVPFPAGGVADIVARLLAESLKSELGRNVMIENKPGGGTVTATAYVIRKPADGDTLLFAATPLAINATLYKRLPYDTKKDLVPVVDVSAGPLALAVPASSPWQTLADLVAAAKQAPDKLTYGSSGNGGSPHLTTEMFKHAAGVQAIHVPYKGSPQSVQDLMAGQTSFVFDTVFILSPFVKAGRLRALAQTGSKRSPSMPDVPTMKESGFPDFITTSWYSIVAPAGTPKDRVDQLNSAVNKVLDRPDVRATMVKGGVEPVGGTPQQAAQRLDEQIAWWGRAVSESGAKVD